MATFARPENALKRAEELINVGQKQEALEALHSFITSRRYRAWTRTHEKIMFKYVELCVDMRRGRHAKDGLIQYRGICQQVNITSLEEVIKHFMQQALEEALDIDDLEADKRPEDLLLSYVTGEKGKDRSDMELVTPWFKFLWETYRSVLEILRNNSRLEAMTPHRAFQFCKQYKRTTEFRRLCEIIRNHLANLNKLCKQCVLASRVAQSFIRFGSYQLHASRGKDDLGLLRSLADYTIRHHFPHLQNLSKSDILSFSTGEGEDSVVDLTSNKYAGCGNYLLDQSSFCVFLNVCQQYAAGRDFNRMS